jgi:hypothetical protein
MVDPAVEGHDDATVQEANTMPTGGLRASAFREAVEAARCDPAHLRGLIVRLEQARGVAVRDNRSTGHVLALLNAIAANVAALRRVLAGRKVKMDR